MNGLSTRIDVPMASLLIEIVYRYCILGIWVITH